MQSLIGVKKQMKLQLMESNMYEPIRQMLNGLGFIVRGEVKNCDIAAIKEGEIWVVEMKLSANLTLIYQAMERKAITDYVFIAIPRPKNSRSKNFVLLKRIISKLELGLILVSLDSPVPLAEIVIQPICGKRTNPKKTESVRKEILGRSPDTTGGATKTRLSTAYRERCIKIACLLGAKGELSSRELLKLGCEKDTATILRNNHYGWFAKMESGKYSLSIAGNEYLHTNADSPLVMFYKKLSNLPLPRQDLLQDAAGYQAIQHAETIVH